MFFLLEQDSSEDNHFLNGNENSNNDATSHEPVEIKGEPVPKSVGLVSPVPTMPAHHVPSSSSLVILWQKIQMPDPRMKGCGKSLCLFQFMKLCYIESERV